MSRYAWPVQQAIFGLLTGGSPSIAGGRVYDGVAPDQAIIFPYVVIGETDGGPVDSTKSDGTSDFGVEEFITLHLWDRPNPNEAGTVVGYKRVKQLAAEIYDLLHESSPTIAGRPSVNIFFENDRFFMDPDGRTRHGVVVYKALHRS